MNYVNNKNCTLCGGFMEVTDGDSDRSKCLHCIYFNIC